MYLDALYGDDHTRVQVPLINNKVTNGQISMQDRASLVGQNLIYVSTHEDPGEPRASWAAVYSTKLNTGSTRRLTPYGVADFSPATSPSGMLTAVASFETKGWGGEIEGLVTDIYIFRTEDGSGRVKVAERGGWPSWADESSLYFHRKGDDGWWSIYKVSLGGDSPVTQRVTPPGVHAFTPAASAANKTFITVATRRPDTLFRHIEIYDLNSKKFFEVTRPISPNSNHYNPFVSPDSTMVGYHKCGASEKGRKNNRLLFEKMQTSTPEVSLFRVDGSFSSFSPNGDRFSFVNLAPNDGLGLYVINRDGSGLKQIMKGSVFSTAWDPKRDGVLYVSVGPTPASEVAKVDVLAIKIDSNGNEISRKKLTTGGGNNAFPFPSPDGKWVVFRSGRSGYKNLYIMSAERGEKDGLFRLTEGPWADTMCNWGPNGDWIAFSSDRENPGSGNFSIFMIHPNRTGLRKLVDSGPNGQANHPYFSPNGKYIAFTSDYAAVSAEPISNPQHFRPYGDIFTVKLDGSELRRLTHNSYEDGAPLWVPEFIEPNDVAGPSHGPPQCSFDDCLWLGVFPNTSQVSVDLRSTKVPCVH